MALTINGNEQAELEKYSVEKDFAKPLHHLEEDKKQSEQISEKAKKEIEHLPEESKYLTGNLGVQVIQESYSEVILTAKVKTYAEVREIFAGPTQGKQEGIDLQEELEYGF